MLVKATNKYKELNLKDNELGRIPEMGEIFEVTKERYKVLTQTNKFNTVFVKKVEEVTENKTKTTKKGTKKNEKENRR